jgi:hypothetical protein
MDEIVKVKMSLKKVCLLFQLNKNTTWEEAVQIAEKSGAYVEIIKPKSTARKVDNAGNLRKVTNILKTLIRTTNACKTDEIKNFVLGCVVSSAEKYAQKITGKSITALTTDMVVLRVVTENFDLTTDVKIVELTPAKKTGGGRKKADATAKAPAKKAKK